MLSAEIGLLLLCILLVIGNTFGLYKLLQTKLEKNLSHQSSSLIIDVLKVYGFRSFSAIFQVLLYTSLVLLILSKLLSKNFLWNQIGSFFLGGISMSVLLFILIGITPQLIPVIIQKSKGYLKDGLHLQFNITTMISFIIISIILINGILLLLLGSYKLLIGYGLGIVYASFFIRIAGGLFSASSEIGFSISKTKNKNLPHHDDRNPGLIIEIASDYINKLCGFSADIIGSFILSVLSCVLFAFAFEQHNIVNETTYSAFKSLPWKILFISLCANILGVILTKIRISQNKHQNMLLESLYLVIIICAVSTFFLTSTLPKLNLNSIWLGKNTFLPFFAYLSGLLGAGLICYSSELLTSKKHSIAKTCASQQEFGSSIIHLYAFSIGFKSNLIYLIYIIIISGISYFTAGLYGISLASIGMLCVITTIISINSFLPLSKSASKISHLSTSSTTIHTHTNKMKQIGESTLAIGNSYSTITTLISCFGLFFSFICFKNYSFKDVFFMDTLLIGGLILGVVIPLSSTGFLLDVCMKISKTISSEIRKQFEQIPYLLQGKAKPDVVKLSDTITRLAMDGLIAPGILTVLIPILLGYLIDVSISISFALGTLLLCIALSFSWGNSGDIIQNAKLYIDNGRFGGKESITYPSIQQMQNISCVYKDILSPSLSIFAKSIMILTAIIMIFVS
jgi:K(+)-stimulated pyrophosphate-energized sodium pump